MTLSNQTALTDTEIPAQALFPSLEWDRGGDEGRQTERQNARARSRRWERKHFFGMRQNTITRETYFSKTEKKAIYGRRKGSRDLLEWKVHDLFRNVLCMEFSGLWGTWGAMTWLAVSLRLRRLIGCGTFHILTHSNLHSHWCRPIKLYMAVEDSWNVLNLS